MKPDALADVVRRVPTRCRTSRFTTAGLTVSAAQTTAFEYASSSSSSDGERAGRADRRDGAASLSNTSWSAGCMMVTPSFMTTVTDEHSSQCKGRWSASDDRANQIGAAIDAMRAKEERP